MIIRIPGTIICAEPCLLAARELAAALNDEEGGRDTFALDPLRQTPDGRRWSVASGHFTQAFLTGFGQPLQPRPWFFDMALATSAQGMLNKILPLDDGTWPALKPDRINYVIGMDGAAMMPVWGLAWPDA